MVSLRRKWDASMLRLSDDAPDVGATDVEQIWMRFSEISDWKRSVR